MLGNGLADTGPVDNNVCKSMFARLGVLFFFKLDLASYTFGCGEMKTRKKRTIHIRITEIIQCPF